MKILAVGGGSGGHVTPAVAVVRELKKQAPAAQVRFWCDRKFAPQAKGIVHHFDATIPVEAILAGKFRRYHTLPLWRQVLRPFSIVLPNIRDLIFVGLGFIQSIAKLLFWRPDVVFTKGGFVCLPVGWAASLLRIPLVIHDSDAHPGLTNRLLARHAVAIATGAPLKNYSYPPQKTQYVGVPIDSKFRPVTPKRQRELKKKVGVDVERPLIVVTGGGLGAQNINLGVAKGLGELLRHCSVVMISGAKLYDEMRALTPRDDLRFQLHAFISEGMGDYLGAADIVVTRAGATTILELAALAKPTILIPSPYLSAGHQLKNAAELSEQGVVEVVDELELDRNPDVLVGLIAQLLAQSERLNYLGRAFHAVAKPHAARDMAAIVLSAARPK